MRRRSSTRRCLLCLGHCVSSSEEEEDQEEDFGIIAEKPGRLTMAGAGKSNQLRLQLEKIFVIRKILDIPESWCEETLQNYNGGGEDSKISSESGGVDGNPANWFALCNQCMDTSVNEIWSIYQQIMALEVKMKEMKERVKDGMLKEIMRPRNRNWGRSVNDGVEGKIIRFVFPELTVRSAEDSDGDYNVEDNEGVDMGLEFEMEDIHDYSDDFSGGEDDVTPKALPRRRKKTKKSSPNKTSKKRVRKRVRNRKSRSNGTWFGCSVPECKARYHNQEDLDSHTLVHEERKQNGEAKTELDCQHCPFPARDKTELEMHIEARHRFQNRPYYFPCPKCDFKTQDDFPSLKSHYDKEHASNDQILASDQPIQCETCQKRCECLRSFFIHQKSCNPEKMGMEVGALECNHCGLKLSTQLELQNHMISKHITKQWTKRFVCDECGVGFMYRGRLNRHKIKHQNNRNWVCQFCGLDYGYQWLLDDHCRKFHPPAGEEVQFPKKEGGKNQFTCRFCEFTCNIKGIMMRHMQQHKEESGFKCSECGKSYVNEAGLKRHVKIIHPSTSAVFPCTYCSKPFQSMDYMRHHMRKNCKIAKLQKNQSSLASEDSVPVVVAMESINIDLNSGVIQNDHDVTTKTEFILPDIQ